MNNRISSRNHRTALLLLGAAIAGGVVGGGLVFLLVLPVSSAGEPVRRPYPKLQNAMEKEQGWDGREAGSQLEGLAPVEGDLESELRRVQTGVYGLETRIDQLERTRKAVGGPPAQPELEQVVADVMAAREVAEEQETLANVEQQLSEAAATRAYSRAEALGSKHGLSQEQKRELYGIFEREEMYYRKMELAIDRHVAGRPLSSAVVIESLQSRVDAVRAWKEERLIALLGGVLAQKILDDDIAWRGWKNLK